MHESKTYTVLCICICVCVSEWVGQCVRKVFSMVTLPFFNVCFCSSPSLSLCLAVTLKHCDKLVKSRSSLLLFHWPQLTQSGNPLSARNLWPARAWDLLPTTLEAIWKESWEGDSRDGLWRPCGSVAAAAAVFRARSHHLHVMQNVNMQQVVPVRPHWIKCS